MSVIPDQILVTSGTSPALLMVMIAILEQDEEVIISNPHYACYPNFIETVGGRVIKIRTSPEHGFLYRPEDIKKVISTQNYSSYCIHGVQNHIN